MSDLKKEFLELGYDTLGLKGIVCVMDFMAATCVGGQCDAGCLKSCTSCSVSCSSGGIKA